MARRNGEQERVGPPGTGEEATEAMCEGPRSSECIGKGVMNVNDTAKRHQYDHEKGDTTARAQHEGRRRWRAAWEPGAGRRTQQGAGQPPV